VKLPYADVEETTPPSTEHFLAILEKLATRLPPVFVEQTAASVAELRAWRWQDVDVTGSRIRSRGVKGRRGTLAFSGGRCRPGCRCCSSRCRRTTAPWSGSCTPA
jgi:hypothetical protein